MTPLRVSLFVLFAGLCVNAQTSGRSKRTNRTDVTNVRKIEFQREKFDPKRDPRVDLSEAVTKATASDKRIILDVGGEWCVWCVYMDRFFVENPGLEKRREANFVWLKVNMGPDNENKTFLSIYPEAKGYPHLYVLDQAGKLLQSQDTSALEQGKGYNLIKFTRFLKAWSPKRLN